MARVEAAFLCQSVMFHDSGLFSALGIGMSEFRVPTLPSALAFTVVTIVKWERAEAGEPHLVVLRVELGDETVARAELPLRALPWREGEGSGTNVAYGFAFDARRAGRYQVVASNDGEELCRLPLRVESDLPAV